MKNVVLTLGRFILHIAALRLNTIQRNVTPAIIKTWFEKHPTFFILSIGRSGSFFLADLLNETREYTVIHEPNRLDFIAYLSAFHGPETAFNYVIRFRKNLIYHLAQNSGGGNYGEVNSVLRRHACAIKSEIPNTQLVHLVRDGRDVVRSMMARRTFTIRDPVTLFISPHIKDEYGHDWKNMNRFEKLCWYWLVENQFLRENINRTVRFEDIISNYSTFSKSLVDPLGLDIPEETWRRKIHRPKNVTKQHLIPHWSEWNQDRTDTFQNICGDLMKDFGYKI